MRPSRPLCLMALLGVLGACAPQPRPEGRHGQPPVPALVFSPNGEPLGRDDCQTLLKRWHDRFGPLDEANFKADSLAQFAHMDSDGDGFITSDELRGLRQPFLEHTGPTGAPPPEKPLALRMSGVDPVMAADVNLDFQVSRKEYLAHSAEEFTRLDRNGDHLIAIDELTQSCPKPHKAD